GVIQYVLAWLAGEAKRRTFVAAAADRHDLRRGVRRLRTADRRCGGQSGPAGSGGEVRGEIVEDILPGGKGDDLFAPLVGNADDHPEQDDDDEHGGRAARLTVAHKRKNRRAHRVGERVRSLDYDV